MNWQEVLTRVIEKKLKMLGRDPSSLSDLIFLQDLKVDPDKHLQSFQYIIDLNPQNILEIGCGNGSVLYPFYQLGKSVFGIDYVEKSIEIAKKVMPKGNFECSQANNISFEETFDLILSNSVFQYFDNLDYAKDVIKCCLSKLNRNGNLIITDLPNANMEKEFSLYRMKEMGLSQKEWDQRYAEVKHLNYDLNDLKAFVEKLGFRYKYISPSKYTSKHQAFKFDIWITN